MRILHSLSQKFYRWRLPENLRHQWLAHPSLSLRRLGGGSAEILWRGRAMAATRPLVAVRHRQHGACGIVCTGPSVAEIDLARFAGVPMMGVNGAIHKFRQAGVTPDSFAVTDFDFVSNRFELVREVLESGAHTFLSYEAIGCIAERDPALLARAPIYLMEVVNRQFGIPRRDPAEFVREHRQGSALAFHPTRPISSDPIGFSHDLELGVFCGKTISHRAVQLAGYLGFDKVLLMGMDLGFSGSQVRFYETKEQGRASKLDKDYERSILPSFEVVRDQCRPGRFEVYNLSMVSRLPHAIVPKLSWQEAVERFGAGSARRRAS